MRVNIRLVGLSLAFYACGLFAMYTSGPYFLLSYFAIGDSDQQYDGPILLDIKPGDFLLASKTVTSVSATVDSNDLTLLLSCTFQAPPLYNMSCPSYFYYSHGTCGQNVGSELSFINLAIDTQGETKFSQSPEDVENVEFTFGDDVPDQVGLTMTILQFQEDSEDCVNDADCDQYVQYLHDQDYNIDYNYDSIHCFREELPEFANWPVHGCAVEVEMGTSSTCFDDDIDLICDFATFFSLYEQPPALFTAGNLWKWGVIAFINVEFVFIFLALVYCRWLHLKYLANYYFFENLFTLKKDIAYDFKLTFMGEQFTSHRGVFLLNDPWRGVIFDFPVHVDFPEADVEKRKMSSVELRGSFRPEHYYSNVYFEMDWPEEFAQAAAVIPSVKVQFRQRVPVRVKSRMNVLFFPIFFLVNLTPMGADRSRYLGFGTYCALAIFNSLIQLSWILLVVFTCISLVPWADFGMETFYELIWGTLYKRPPLTLTFYIAFLVLMTLAMVMQIVCTILVYRVNKKKSRTVEVHLTHSDSMTVNERNFNAYDSEASTGVDLSVVDYVAMDDMDSQRVLGPDGTYISTANLSKKEVARLRLAEAAAKEEKVWKKLQEATWTASDESAESDSGDESDSASPVLTTATAATEPLEDWGTGEAMEVVRCLAGTNVGTPVRDFSGLHREAEGAARQGETETQTETEEVGGEETIALEQDLETLVVGSCPPRLQQKRH